MGDPYGSTFQLMSIKEKKRQDAASSALRAGEEGSHCPGSKEGWWWGVLTPGQKGPLLVSLGLVFRCLGPGDSGRRGRNAFGFWG